MGHAGQVRWAVCDNRAATEPPAAHIPATSEPAAGHTPCRAPSHSAPNTACHCASQASWTLAQKDSKSGKSAVMMGSAGVGGK